MEAVASPGAAEPDMREPLYLRQLPLRFDGGQVEYRVAVMELAMHLGRGDGAGGVQGHHHRLLPGQGLQAVDPVVQADRSLFAGHIGPFIVPGRPGPAPLGEH